MAMTENFRFSPLGLGHRISPNEPGAGNGGPTRWVGHAESEHEVEERSQGVSSALIDEEGLRYPLEPGQLQGGR